MKILLLNYEFPPLGGGASPVSYDIALRLSTIGKFDIDVVTMHYRGLPRKEIINEHFTIYRVPSWRAKKEICHPWEQLTYLISGFFKCLSLIHKNKYNLCYCHFIIPTGVLAYLLKILFKLPYIITSHGSDVIKYNPRFKRIYPLITGVWKTILKNSLIITTPSIFLARQIKNVYPKLDSNKIKIIPNGIEKNKFSPLKKEKTILLVTRILLNKGVQVVLEAVKGTNINDWNIIIVGEGPARKQLEILTRHYKLDKKVTFLGWVKNPSEKLRNLYGSASIFVLPSFFENMNVTLLEAMASGCAILATNVGGNPEVIGSAGILFSPRNPAELRKKLLDLINNEKNLSLFKQASRIRFEKYFSWEIIIQEYLNVFCEK
ncbi:MAG: glycosyltransferase family 4 protein [Patescibacteria group bacterium]|jgi:glycosyltransferase involved in cell wall biosynthesis